MSKKMLNWSDRLALIAHYAPTDIQICNAFNLSQDELDTARSLQASGTFVPNTSLDMSSYSGMFIDTPTVGAPAATVINRQPGGGTTHTKPETATMKVKVPQKRGRKGSSIINALSSVPEVPVSVEKFMQQHRVSLAVLRQSKRFIGALDPSIQDTIGKVNVRQNKITKVLEIWRENKK